MMTKFPYVLEYKLFERIDLGEAEELLDEYKDFYEYNKVQVGQVKETDDDFHEVYGTDEEEKPAEQSKESSTEHFQKLFGSKDFAEACLLGMKIDFNELQKILMAEHRKGVPITESALNTIAPKLRATASILLFAEKIMTAVQKFTDKEDTKRKAELLMDFARTGFESLLERHAKGEVSVPDYNKNKKEITKIKNVDGYLELCERLFNNKGE